MKNSTPTLFGVLLLTLIYSFGSMDLSFETPEGWPEPVYNFENNALTDAKIELGRQLFYEPLLSQDSTISCNSCHLQYTAFTHVDHDLSHGIKGRIGTRNSQTLMNLAWSPSFMWDGAINHLDMQALAPIEHVAEMDSDINLVIERLQSTPKYPVFFKEAFGDTTITGERFLKSMSSFILTLVSANAKYDQVMRKEEGISFTEQEEKGYRIFKTHCASCHQEPLFTNFSFENNGLPVDTTLNDWGRMMVTRNPEDSLKFKVPSLRNIEFSYPYMHDGRFRKLSEVIKHYTDGVEQNETNALQLQDKLSLDHKDKVDLVAFLLTLTDKTFLFNPKHSFPRN